MIRFLLRRFGQALIVLFVVSVVVFVLPRLISSPAEVLLPPNATETQVRALEHLWGLDQPLWVQYGAFVRNAVEGNFGDSRVFDRTASQIIASRLPVTISLALIALVLIVPLGVGGGLVSALRRGKPADVGLRGGALIFQSLPSFWLGIVLILLFAVRLHWFPSSGVDTWAGYLLPAVALAHFPLAAMLRITRVSMLEVLSSDYVEFARAKGMPEHRVVLRHALRNALITPLTYFGFTLAALLTGSVVVETVFALPGVGALAVESIRNLDYAVVQALVLLFAVIYLGANLLVDIAYGIVDPRLREAR